MKLKSYSILSTNFIFNEPGRFAAWPSIAKTSTGDLLVAFSGDRLFHIDPYGKIILCRSSDQGFSWSLPAIINNTPLDDRDPGILETKQDTWLVTFFTSRLFADWQEQARRYYGDSAVDLWQPYIKKITPEICQKYLGAFVIRSSDRGKTWGPLIPTPVHSPHGIIQGRAGKLLYLGNGQVKRKDVIAFCESQDDGLLWKIKSVVCPIDIYQHVRFYEPHLVELPSGKLLGLLRANALKEEDRYLYQVESIDKGNSWTSPEKTTIWGLPPHLLLHSSGVLILVYGHRRPPYGQRAAISYDEGNNWQYEMILSEFNYEEERIPSTIGPDDRPSHSIYYQVPDLGYPSSVELSDGTIFTVYYQSCSRRDWTTIIGTNWKFDN